MRFDAVEPGACCTSTSRYSLGDTNDPRNLVFPFYVIPRADGGPVGAA